MTKEKLCVIAVYIPGQLMILQDCIAEVEPGQTLPSYCGDGLVHDLVFCCCPVSHVVEHDPQADQADQPP